MIADVHHAAVHLTGNAGRNMGFAAALTKIQNHAVLKLVNVFDPIQLFALANVIIDELIGLFYIQAARDCSHCAHLCYKSDENILCVTKGRGRHSSLPKRHMGRSEKALELLYVAIFYMLIEL